jgi:hypothetical protein
MPDKEVFMRLHPLRIFSILLAASFALPASPAAAGPFFRLEVGPAFAGSPNKVKNAVFVVRPLACTDPGAAIVTGVAEGTVNGVRRTIPLKLVRLDTRGVHAVTRQWPEGTWVVTLSGKCGTSVAGAIVPIGKSGFVRDASRLLDHAATPPEVDATLAALARGSEH